MKQVQRIVTLALALVLIGLPAVTMAQTSSSPSSTTDKAGADKATDKAAPSASPSGSTSGTAGQASPAMPMSAEDCKNNGWQKFGAKSEAECVTKVKK